MAFLWSLFIAFFILLCLASCEHKKATTSDREFIKIGLSSPSDNSKTQTITNTIKWQKE
jgi:hypothetical protein